MHNGLLVAVQGIGFLLRARVAACLGLVPAKGQTQGDRRQWLFDLDAKHGACGWGSGSKLPCRLQSPHQLAQM